MRAHLEPQLYQRGVVWWCYWQGERWSTGQVDRGAASRVVRERYDPRLATAREKVVEDAIRLLYDALERRGRSAATRGAARQKLGHFARLWAGRSLASIDWPAVSEYIRVRLEVDKVARLTVSQELAYLRQAWKLARASGWAPRAWDELMPERFDRCYVPRTRWLTVDELRRVLEALPVERAAWVAWMVATGSDVSDVGRAEPGDLDWKRSVVRVRGTKTVFRDRFVPVTKLTRHLLRLAEKHGPPFAPWPWVNRELRKLAARLELEHFSPKDLRRTHGQWLRAAGVAPQLIGRVLGHADSEMADRVYAQGDELAIARLVRHAVGRTDDVRMRRAKVGRRPATGRKSAGK